MDPNSFVNVNFWNVTWPKMSLPSRISKNVRCYFITNDDGTLMDHDILKDVLKAWLFDEFNVCPLDFEFQVEP